jgi:hypothetical protein
LRCPSIKPTVSNANKVEEEEEAEKEEEEGRRRRRYLNAGGGGGTDAPNDGETPCVGLCGDCFCC